MQESDLIRQLRSTQSAKRRSAAKKLRKLADSTAGPALLDALKHELPDKRTWETQYQMIMALGHCGYREAAPLLLILAREKFEATMVLVAIGDAYVRLCCKSDNDSIPLLEILAVSNDEGLLDGALRATAMLHMSFDSETTASIIKRVVSRKSERLKFWLAVACAGWSGPSVDRFLDQCLASVRDDVRNAASDAKLKKYRKWTPL